MPPSVQKEFGTNLSLSMNLHALKGVPSKVLMMSSREVEIGILYQLHSRRSRLCWEDVR